MTGISAITGGIEQTAAYRKQAVQTEERAKDLRAKEEAQEQQKADEAREARVKGAIDKADETRAQSDDKESLRERLEDAADKNASRGSKLDILA